MEALIIGIIVVICFILILKTGLVHRLERYTNKSATHYHLTSKFRLHQQQVVCAPDRDYRHSAKPPLESYDPGLHRLGYKSASASILAIRLLPSIPVLSSITALSSLAIARRSSTAELRSPFKDESAEGVPAK